MGTRVPLAVLAALALGCASGGGGNDLPPTQVYASADVDQLPRVVVCEGYAPAPTRRSISVRIIVGVDGSVTQVDSAGGREGAAQARSQARDCKFEPARLNGRPVAVRYRVDIRVPR